jgi:hypothetical protein
VHGKAPLRLRFDLDRPGYSATHDTHGSVQTTGRRDALPDALAHWGPSAPVTIRVGGGDVTADSEQQHRDDQGPERLARGEHVERDAAKADEANGEGDAANDTEARYGEGESPA